MSIQENYCSTVYCRAFKEAGCSGSAAPDVDMPEIISKTLQASDWLKNMQNNASGPLKPHQKLKISLAGCANGCSRPHIHDLGVMGAITPCVDLSLCNGCGICVDECPDRAIFLAQEQARVDYGQCLSCGKCLGVCPQEAITAREQGFRVVIGGKLGRRPVLACELEGLFSADEVVHILVQIMDLHEQALEQGKRIRDMPQLKGLPGWRS